MTSEVERPIEPGPSHSNDNSRDLDIDNIRLRKTPPAPRRVSSQCRKMKQFPNLIVAARDPIEKLMLLRYLPSLLLTLYHCYIPVRSCIVWHPLICSRA